MGQIGNKLIAALCRAKCQGPQHMGVLGHGEAVPELHRAILLPQAGLQFRTGEQEGIPMHQIIAARRLQIVPLTVKV